MKLNKSFKIITYSSLIMFTISSCDDFKEGIVIDKWYEAEERKTYAEFSPIFKMPMTKIVVDDEDYVLIVKGVVGKDTIQRRFEVSKNDYDNTKIGNKIKFN